MKDDVIWATGFGIRFVYFVVLFLYFLNFPTMNTFYLHSLENKLKKKKSRIGLLFCKVRKSCFQNALKCISNYFFFFFQLKKERVSGITDTKPKQDAKLLSIKCSSNDGV